MRGRATSSGSTTSGPYHWAGCGRSEAFDGEKGESKIECKESGESDKAGAIMNSKDFNAIGSLKMVLLEMWADERTALHKRAVTQVEEQRENLSRP